MRFRKEIPRAKLGANIVTNNCSIHFFFGLFFVARDETGSPWNGLKLVGPHEVRDVCRNYLLILKRAARNEATPYETSGMNHCR